VILDVGLEHRVQAGFTFKRASRFEARLSGRRTLSREPLFDSGAFVEKRIARLGSQRVGENRLREVPVFGQLHHHVETVDCADHPTLHTVLEAIEMPRALADCRPTAAVFPAAR